MTDTHCGASRIAGPDACSKILLVGEMNPYGADPRYALYNQPENSAGGRLQRLIFGIDGRRWYLPMWRVNLCVGSFDFDKAERRAAELAEPAPWTTIVLLGVKVATAFGRVPVGGASVRLLIPHPSGRNASRWDAEAIQRTRQRLSEIAPEIPWGELK